jgi:hypothetical protein
MEWHQFLMSEVDNENLCLSVFTPNQHNLGHAKKSILNLSVPRASSCRSQERTIKRAKKIFGPHLKLGVGAGKAMEQMAIQDVYNDEFNLESDDDEEVDDLAKENKKIRVTKWDGSLSLADSDVHSPELWGPIYTHAKLNTLKLKHKTIGDIPSGVILDALKSYYCRQDATINHQSLDLSIKRMTVSGRAWFDGEELNAALYMNRLRLRTKANEIVMFYENSGYETRTWFAGAVLFFFEYTYEKQDFLAFIKLADDQSTCNVSNTVPVVTIFEDTFYFGRNNKPIAPSQTSRYAVINIDQISTVVGTPARPYSENEYALVSPKILHGIDYSINIGSLSIFHYH